MPKLSLAISLALLTTIAFAQNELAAKEIRLPPGGQLPPQGEASLMRDCIVRNVSVTNDGHTWNIDVTNNCGDRAWACNFFAALKASDGTTSNVGCSAIVSASARGARVCTVTNPKKTWMTATGNIYQCHY